MKWLCIVGLALVSGFATAGCEVARDDSKPTKLLVGKVDSAVVLQSDPEYMTMAQHYLREQTDLRAGFMKRAKEAGNSREVVEGLKVEFAKKQQEMNKKWMANTNEFLTTRHSRMRTIVEQICKDKGIDIVLIDSKQYATVEFGAVDITQDVLLKTSGGNAPVSSTPSASPK